MRTRKRLAFVASAATALTALALLSGCGNSSTNNASNSTNKSFEIASDRWSDWGTTYTNYPNALAKKAGITIKWDTYIDANWADKKSTILASGKLPDAFIGNNTFTDQQIAQNQSDFIALN